MNYKQMESLYKYTSKTEGTYGGVANMESVKLGDKTRLFRTQENGKIIYVVTVNDTFFIEAYPNNMQKILTKYVNTDLTLLKLNLYSKFRVTKNYADKLQIHVGEEKYEVTEGLLL